MKGKGVEMGRAWQLVGYRRMDDRIMWTNAAMGENDCAFAVCGRDIDWDDATDIPPASAEIEYGALDEYNGDYIAAMNDWGYDRETTPN